jgi:N-acetylglutamate synthase-like GNAT family acetyltransferase
MNEQERTIRRATIDGLKIVIRQADNRDIGFIYELMRNHLEKFFSDIKEGWSRKKFKEGYLPERIFIIEHDNIPIGFFDFEYRGKEVYVHNLHISDDYQGRGIGSYALGYIEGEGIRNNASHIIAKAFKSNKALGLMLTGMKFSIAKELPEENSLLLSKSLEMPK